MKNALILLFCLFSLQAFAATTEVDVLSADYGVEDDEQKKSLCLTVVRVPDTGSLLGVVEDIHDCFYARSAKRSPTHRLEMDLKRLQKIDSPPLRRHLQRMDSQLEFYFSDGE